MKILCLFVAFLALGACEFDTRTGDSNTDDDSNETRLNQAIQPILVLEPNSAQKNAAERVCRNLRAQRARLRSLPNGTEQYFRTREKTCPDGQTLRNQARAELQREASGPYWQTSQSVNIHSPILTDRSSIFDRLCEDIDAELEVENTQLISSRQFQFSFQSFPSDDLDTVKIISYEMDRGSWRAKRIEEYDIQRGSANPDKQGQTSAQNHLYFCRNSESSGELWQQTL